MFAGVVHLGDQRVAQKEDVAVIIALKNRCSACKIHERYSPNAVLVSSEPSHTEVRNRRNQVCGEIFLYNRSELAAKLGLTQQEVTGYSDTGLVSLGYEQWGEELPRHLVGDFAFVVWDEARKRALAVRDHLGIKPLYYRLSGSRNRFEFSGQLAALTEGSVAVDNLNIAFIVDYLLGRHATPIDTVYDNIHQVPPASSLLFDEQGVHIQQYWFPRLGKRIRSDHERDYGAEFRTLLGEVIESRLPQDSRSGLLFSGGLDSTALLYTLLPICRQKGKELLLFSHIPQPTGANRTEGDARYIEIALQDAEISTRYCSDDDPKLMRGDLDAFFARRGTFAWTPFINRSFPLQRLIAQQQIDFIFSGLGGDEIVSLEPRWHFASSLFLGRWRKMITDLSRRKHAERVSWWRVVRRTLVYPLLPEKIQQAYSRWHHGCKHDNTTHAYINTNILNTENSVKRNRTGEGRRKKSFDPRVEIVEVVSDGYFSSSLNVLGANEEIMRCRYNLPFLDKRIVEFCLSLPGEEYIKEDIPRIFIRNAMKGLVPEEIRMRRDKSLLGPLDVEMLRANKELFEDIVDTDSALTWKILDREGMRSAFSQLSKLSKNDKEARESGTQLGRCLNVAAFLQWFEKKDKHASCADVIQCPVAIPGTQ